MDLIDRAKVERITFQEPSYNDPINVLTEVRDKVRALPTIEAEPVRHGEWLTIIEANEYGEPYQSGVYCSECGETSIYEPNYCPNCGARMDGAERKEE